MNKARLPGLIYTSHINIVRYATCEDGFYQFFGSERKYCFVYESKMGFRTYLKPLLFWWEKALLILAVLLIGGVWLVS